MSRIEIDKDQVLNPGDRVELHFKSSGMAWVKAAQIAIIDARINRRDDWRIREFRTPDDQPTVIICVVEVLTEEQRKAQAEEDQPEIQTASAGVVITCAAIAGTIIAAGVVYSLTLQKTFLIVKDISASPAGKVAVAGGGVGLAAAGIAALLAILLPKGK